MTKNTSEGHTILEKVLLPENELERQLLEHPEVRHGLLWGKPRHGHPEGAVYKHVREVFDNIEKLQLAAQQRQQLRTVALIHDTFKFKEDANRPRDWNRHHGVIAKRFMTDYIKDDVVLTIIQWHDEAYYIWREMVVRKNTEKANFRMNRLLNKLKGQNQLYYLFFYCDSKTGDKNPAPIRWVEEHLTGIDLVK